MTAAGDETENIKQLCLKVWCKYVVCEDLHCVSAAVRKLFDQLVLKHVSVNVAAASVISIMNSRGSHAHKNALSTSDHSYSLAFKIMEVFYLSGNLMSFTF